MDIFTQLLINDLVVEHNIKSLLRVVHRGYLLDKGQIVAHAPASELIESNLIEKVFMGKLVD